MDPKKEILQDGYFEWQQLERGKKPWFFQSKNDKLLAFAGLWDTWTNPQGTVIPSLTIIVRPAIGGIEEIHDRMPAILPEETRKEWLDPEKWNNLAGMKDRLIEDPEPLE